MEVLHYIWDTFLFLPLVNILMYLYATIGAESYALAIAELVILMRLVLLPLSFVEERNKAKYHRLSKALEEIKKKHAYDAVTRDRLVREALKVNKIKPSAKFILLGVQGVVLFLFYVVNLKAIEYLDSLYSFVPKITEVNTVMLGRFDLLQPSWLLASVCGLYLYGKILIDHAGRKATLTDGDKIYRFLFPLFTIVFLGLIPAAKSVFVLTSMLISTVIHNLRLIWAKFNPEMDAIQLDIQPEVLDEGHSFAGSPWDRLKK